MSFVHYVTEDIFYRQLQNSFKQNLFDVWYYRGAKKRLYNRSWQTWDSQRWQISRSCVILEEKMSSNQKSKYIITEQYRGYATHMLGNKECEIIAY